MNGATDKGPDGIRNFFVSHQCTWLCHSLELTPFKEADLEPKLTLTVNRQESKSQPNKHRNPSLKQQQQEAVKGAKRTKKV